MNMNHAMIIGATGITGGYILNEIAGREGWTVTGLCRNPPAEKPPILPPAASTR